MERERLQWLDALRGCTMVLVVAYHVAQMSFCESEKLSASLPFLVLMRMPAFFFVSGFLAHGAGFGWTPRSAARLAWRKLRVQVIPALVFLCVFIVLRRGDFWQCFTLCMRSPEKGGYWFTWVLLQMFIVYYAACLAGRGRNWPVWALWAASVAAYETLYMPRYFRYHQECPFFAYTSLVDTIKYMQFFLFGNLARRHWAGAQRVLDSRWLFPAVVALAFVCCADFFRWHYLCLMWTNLPRTLSMYLLVVVLVAFFRHYEARFSKDRPLGRCLQHIGTRTLDIYLLHYILLPVMPGVGAWLDANRPNFAVDIALSVGVGLVVIGFSLLVSDVLRISPFLSRHLFGKK